MDSEQHFNVNTWVQEHLNEIELIAAPEVQKVSLTLKDNLSLRERRLGIFTIVYFLYFYNIVATGKYNSILFLYYILYFITWLS